MKKICLESAAAYIALLPMFFLLSSCSDEDYLNTIPSNSIALTAVDMQRLDGKNIADKICKTLNIDNIENCGLDLKTKLYIFETQEGNIGLSAKVADEGDLEKCLNIMAKDGYCQNISKYRDYKFTIIKQSWVAGFSSDALVVMGPALPAQQADLKRQIARCLGLDADQGIKDTPIFNRLDSIDSPISLVAQAAALPDKFSMPFTLCAPKDADASQVMIAAGVEKGENDCLVIRGETFSFNKDINEKIKASSNVFRPIKGTYVANMQKNFPIGVFMNVDGRELISLLHSNKTSQALLAGMNMAVDMDNIIKSIDGDMAIFLSATGENTDIGMAAQLRDKKFLDDVGYWKQSCPPGSRITDWDKDAYCYTNGEMSYYFGVSQDLQFYAGVTENGARGVLSKSEPALPAKAMKMINGQRLAVVLNASALFGNGNVLEDFTGNTGTVLFIMK